jgi:shikimate kinase
MTIKLSRTDEKLFNKNDQISYMVYFIIIRGPLGIGKSTIAKALAQLLKAEYISFDKVLKENGLDKEDNDFIPEDFIKANEIVLPKVKDSLEKDKIVVFDGNFYFKEQIEHLKENLPYKGHIFDLKAPIETCIERDSKRKRVYGEKATREVYELVAKFDYGIKINTDKKTEGEVTMEILSSLNNLKLKKTIANEIL